MPIEISLNQVCRWANEVLGEDIAHLTSPSVSDRREVAVHLLEMIPVQQARGPKQEVRLQIALRYLVTASGDTPQNAHQLLARLLFAAMQNAEFEVEKDPPPIQVWQAFGIAPRPAFTVRHILSQELPKKPVRFVHEVVVQTVPVGSLAGTIVGPQEIPLADALVELPSINASVRTDHNGRFEFRNVPLGDEFRPRTLIVHAKGRKQTFDLHDHPESPLTIQFFLEDAP